MQRCALALGGRTFVLTTTLRSLQQIGAALRERLAPDGIAVFVQGEAPKRAMLAQFLAAPRGRRVAIANHRNEVLIGNLDDGSLTLVERGEPWPARKNGLCGRFCDVLSCEHNGRRSR